MSGQKTVWVTGASSGLGLHTAIQLQKDGWRVIAGARSFEEGEKDGMYRLKLDVTDEESVRRFCEKAAEIAPPDALVQCAGMLVLGSCEKTETEEFRRVIDTNYLGMVRVNRSVLPIMRAQGGGKIVMFSSINGLLGIPFQSAYTASKHAIEGYAECLSMEVKPFGIQVMLVEPGDHRSGSDKYRPHAAAMSDALPMPQNMKAPFPSLPMTSITAPIRISWAGRLPGRWTKRRFPSGSGSPARISTWRSMCTNCCRPG